MKHSFLIILVLVLISCSSTQLVNNWVNPDIDTYSPSKVLVVGMTSNIEARQQFEKQLREEFELRGSEAVMSLELFEPTFTTEKKSEKELKRIEDILIANGFDTILFTKIVGVENKVTRKNTRNDYNDYYETYKDFSEDYLTHQEIYYNPDYYNEYKVYHAETSMYCICPTKDRELIWEGYIDIIDPQSMPSTNKAVNDYIQIVIMALEQHQFINPKISQKSKSDTIN